MNKQQSQVLEFHKTFGAFIGIQPVTIPNEVYELRRNLNEEEFIEFFKARNRTEAADGLIDLSYVLHGCAVSYGVEVQDEDIEDCCTMVRGLIELHVHMERYNLGDEAESIQYYLSSIVNRVRAECVRIGFNYEGGFDEVHRSNMSKLWTLLESKKYAEWCMNENQPHDLTFRSVANVNPNDTALKCLVANRRSDNKVIKSPSYSPANLEKFFYAQG